MRIRTYVLTAFVLIFLSHAFNAPVQYNLNDRENNKNGHFKSKTKVMKAFVSVNELITTIHILKIIFLFF